MKKLLSMVFLPVLMTGFALYFLSMYWREKGLTNEWIDRYQRAANQRDSSIKNTDNCIQTGKSVADQLRATQKLLIADEDLLRAIIRGNPTAIYQVSAHRDSVASWFKKQSL